MRQINATWYEFDILIENSEMKDMGVDNEEKVKFSIDIGTVIAYNETKLGDDDLEGTGLILNGGQALSILYPYDKFVKLMRHDHSMEPA